MNQNIKFIPLKSAASVTSSLSLFPYQNDGGAGWPSDKFMLFCDQKSSYSLLFCKTDRGFRGKVTSIQHSWVSKTMVTGQRISPWQLTTSVPLLTRLHTRHFSRQYITSHFNWESHFENYHDVSYYHITCA